MIAAIGITIAIMLVVVFSKRLMTIGGMEWLEPVSRLAWPWYVPLGTFLCVATGVGLSYLPHRQTAGSTA